ncbi:calcium-dependent protein kinase 33-like [Bidens hawaiensis]|uniref:calcium-dependent protein kinase 33-like n=1 Tax=Bidens hawaiensis TaxID=980011 RepID=UPI0040493B65
MKSKGRYSEKVAAQILCSIMKVVYCLHFMGIMHRDLKPENFMLAKKAASPCFLDYSMLKAIDFGLSAFIDEGKRKKEKVGTAFYVAPEVLLKREAYGEKIDIWSAGVILYMLLTGVPPFNGENDRAIFSTVVEATPDIERCPWPLISKNAKSLVKAMLSLEPEKRPTAYAVLNDQWLKDNGVATENEIKYELEKMRLKEIKPLEEINGLRALFKSFDPNEKQGISCKNLEETFVRNGAPKDAKLIVKAVDTDGNGYIDFNEFITAMGNFRRYESQDLIKSFRHFDKDAKGFLEKGEVQGVGKSTPIDGIDKEAQTGGRDTGTPDIAIIVETTYKDTTSEGVNVACGKKTITGASRATVDIPL